MSHVFFPVIYSRSSVEVLGLRAYIWAEIQGPRRVFILGGGECFWGGFLRVLLWSGFLTANTSREVAIPPFSNVLYFELDRDDLLSKFFGTSVWSKFKDRSFIFGGLTCVWGRCLHVCMCFFLRTLYEKYPFRHSAVYPVVYRTEETMAPAPRAVAPPRARDILTHAPSNPPRVPQARPHTASRIRGGNSGCVIKWTLRSNPTTKTQSLIQTYIYILIWWGIPDEYFFPQCKNDCKCQLQKRAGKK